LRSGNNIAILGAPADHQCHYGRAMDEAQRERDARCAVIVELDEPRALGRDFQGP
jgi:hypothetical protein